jgi:signal transduction histidine kinase/ActR/RegA family two-component response regulator
MSGVGGEKRRPCVVGGVKRPAARRALSSFAARVVTSRDALRRLKFPENATMSGRFRYALVLLFFAMMSLFAGANAYLTLQPLFTTSIRGWGVEEASGALRVRVVNSTGPAASALRVGDEVVSVRGERGERLDPALYPWSVGPGYAYTIEARREGQPLALRLRTTGYPFAHWLAMLLGSLFVPVVFITTGFVLFLLKPHDRRARLLALMFGMVILGAGAYSFDAAPSWLAYEMAVANTITALASAVFLHLFLVFPQTSPVLRRFPRLRFYLYLPSLLTLVPWTFVYMLRWIESPQVAIDFGERHAALAVAVTAVDILYFVAGFVSLGLTYRRSGMRSRGKVRVVFTGSVAGCLPWLAWNVLIAVVGREGVSAWLFEWLLVCAWFPLLLLPAAFSYAIIRHQVIPVSLLLRRSVRYLLVARGFVVVESATAFAVLSFFLLNRRVASLDLVSPLLHTSFAIIATLLCTGLLHVVHRRVMPRIDRRFFRGAYDPQGVLSELGRELNAVGTSAQALQIVADKIMRTLHTECVTAFLREDKSGDYVGVASSFKGREGGAACADAEGEADADDEAVAERNKRLTLPGGAFTVGVLRVSARPLTVNATTPHARRRTRLLGLGRAGDGRRREAETLKKARASLLVPLPAKEGLCGVLALGPKLSELPYSAEDRQLLMSVAWQAAFVIENIRLFECERVKDEQLLQNQKMQAIGRLAGGVAHDFNNLLTVINGYSDLALMRLPAGEPMRHNFEEIRKAGERASGLTRQLLAFSRKQVLQPVVLNLNTVVAEMEEMLQRLIGEDVGLLAVLDPELGQIKADPGQIEQVLLNLAVNARDAMPGGGRLTIQTARVYLDEEYARRHVQVRTGHYAMLAVSDTGSGIDAETRARIFEPFFTTKEKGKGTGLGLATVYGVVKQSGGSIWVYSEIGRGTTFKIYLPLVEQPAETMPKQRGARELPRGTETILLTEDEDLVRRMTREMLEEIGYDVLEAGNGVEALEVAARYEGRIQLLLTDVVMPHMSGRELAEKLAAIRPDAAVLYMSGYTDDAIVHHGVLDLGVAFLEKPYTPETLAHKVRAVIDENVAAQVTVG